MGSEAHIFGRWFGKVDGEPVALEFLADGRLAYVVVSGGKQQIMRLTYRLEGNTLITDQPSHPKEERTTIDFDSTGGMTLEFGGIRTRFIR